MALHRNHILICGLTSAVVEGWARDASELGVTGDRWRCLTIGLPEIPERVAGRHTSRVAREYRRSGWRGAPDRRRGTGPQARRAGRRTDRRRAASADTGS